MIWFTGKCQCLHGYCSIVNGSRTCHCEKGFNFSGRACTGVYNVCGMQIMCNSRDFYLKLSKYLVMLFLSIPARVILRSQVRILPKILRWLQYFVATSSVSNTIPLLRVCSKWLLYGSETFKIQKGLETFSLHSKNNLFCCNHGQMVILTNCLMSCSKLTDWIWLLSPLQSGCLLTNLFR